MDAPNTEFALAGSLEELKTKGRLVVHGRHRPILVMYDRGRVFALDNRCPHMGFPLEHCRGRHFDLSLASRPLSLPAQMRQRQSNQKLRIVLPIDPGAFRLARACSARAELGKDSQGVLNSRILSALIRFWEGERCRRPSLVIFEVE